MGQRVVDVYVSAEVSGSPFTGGVLKPYIYLPEEAIQKLNIDELNAVIAHEIGHIRYYDLLVTMLIQALGDLFWFMPGYRGLSNKLNRLREIVADNWALSVGIKPDFLASALLKLNDIPLVSDGLIHYSAFFREKSLLKERVERLIGQVKEKHPRFGWQFRWVRYGFAILILVIVLNSVFGGNYKNKVYRAPEWIENLFKVSRVSIDHKFYVQA